MDSLPEHDLDEEVLMNIVGTVCAGSAGYRWGRAGVAIVRLSHCFIEIEHGI